MWKTVKLGDVCRINNGGTPKSKVREYWDGGVHWLTPKDMGKLASRYVSETERQISQEGLDNSSAKLIPHQSVILSCRAPIGHVAINEVPMSFNQGCKGLVPSDEILVEYLYYFLVSSRQLLNDLGTGTTFKEISTKTLHQVDVPLPPLAEQQRIGAKLDAAFAEIDRAVEIERQKSSSATAIESQAMSGWLAQHSSQNTVIRIGEAVDEGWIQAPFDGNHGEIHPKAKDYVASGVPFLMASDIKNGHVDLTNCKFLPRQLADTLRKGFARDKDVLLTHKGTIGETAVLSCSFDYVMLTPQVTAYRVLNEGRVSRDFLYYQFKSEHFQRQLKGIAGIGTTRAYIGITRQKDLQLCMPPIQLQNDAVNLMRTIEPSVKQMARTATEKIAQLFNLKSAILAQVLELPKNKAV